MDQEGLVQLTGNKRKNFDDKVIPMTTNCVYNFEIKKVLTTWGNLCNGKVYLRFM
jgi:hypothetical protein